LCFALQSCFCACQRFAEIDQLSLAGLWVMGVSGLKSKLSHLIYPIDFGVPGAHNTPESVSKVDLVKCQGPRGLDFWAAGLVSF